MRPRHVVLATGVSGIPNRPDIPTLRNFSGTILHSSQYGDAEAWKEKSVVVIGSGNSGHDIAQDLYSNGAKVTLVQRSSTLIVNVEPSAQLPYALYDEGLSLEDCDLITASIPLLVAKRSHILLTQQAKKLDQDLLDGLERKGFKLDFGEDGTGWQFKYLTRGGGYYFNVGCSDLIVKGEIALAQFSDIEAFVADGARMQTGETIPADLIVLATGYKGQEHLVGKLFGNDVAARVGPIWGFGEDDELRNMFTPHSSAGALVYSGKLCAVPDILKVPCIADPSLRDRPIGLMREKLPASAARSCPGTISLSHPRRAVCHEKSTSEILIVALAPMACRARGSFRASGCRTRMFRLPQRRHQKRGSRLAGKPPCPASPQKSPNPIGVDGSFRCRARLSFHTPARTRA